MKILLISGHGDGDVGACGCGYREVDLTRELVNLIAPKLRNYASVDVYDQNKNAFYECQRGTFSIGSYDYVLEVHFNAFNGQAYGSEIYVTSIEAGITVEQNIMKHMSKYFTLRDNDSVFDGVKRTNFLVINTVKSRGISGALLETCFIDNQSDMNKYQQNKNAIAQDIVDGIAEGFGLTKGSQPTQAAAPQPAPHPTQRGSKYQVGQTVRFSSCFYNSNDAATGNPNLTVKGMAVSQGTISQVRWVGNIATYNLSNLCWVNDGDIRSVVGASNPTPSASIQKGSTVVVTNPVDVNGTHLGVSGTYTVMELNGSRAVIGRNGVVTAAINVGNLRLA